MRKVVIPEHILATYLSCQLQQSEKQRQQRIYQLQKQRHLGVGNEDTTKEEWIENIRLDTYHSMLNNPALIEYLTLANNGKNNIRSKRDMKVALLKKIIQESQDTDTNKKRPHE